MKILNGYCGIGGNSRDWHGCDVTAVELDPKIANLYQRLNPDHHVITGDLGVYLLNHAHEFDFVWLSPPCPSHSRMILGGKNRRPRYVDMALWQQILFLQYQFDGLFCVENVISYYEPLIAPTAHIGRHAIWANFHIEPFISTIDMFSDESRVVPSFDEMIKATSMGHKQLWHDWLGIYFDDVIYYDGNHCPNQILRNAVHPDIGKWVFDHALMAFMHNQPKQKELL